LVGAIAKQGVECTVVAPTSLFEARYGPLDPRYQEEPSKANARIRVYRPRFISASAKRIGPYNTNELSYRGFRYAAERVLRRIAPSIDILYAHFLFPAGRFVASIGRELDKPSFAAHGDDCIEGPDLKRGGKDFGDLTGIIAVSRRNKEFCETHLKFPSERIAVFPNGVDNTIFYPRDKKEMRIKYGLPSDKILVAFSGHFIPRKGPDRVLKAIEPLREVRAVMMGAGPVRVESPQIVFKKPVPNYQVAELLSACDLFVLPTMNEGCCNAILEAFACGLPVITSKGDFNDEIVDDEVGIRIDPMNIQEIREAISKMISNPGLREEKQRRSLEHSKKFSLEARAIGIIGWMQEMKSKKRENN